MGRLRRINKKLKKDLWSARHSVVRLVQQHEHYDRRMDRLEADLHYLRHEMNKRERANIHHDTLTCQMQEALVELGTLKATPAYTIPLTDAQLNAINHGPA